MRLSISLAIFSPEKENFETATICKLVRKEFFFLNGFNSMCYTTRISVWARLKRILLYQNPVPFFFFFSLFLCLCSLFSRTLQILLFLFSYTAIFHVPWKPIFGDVHHELFLGKKFYTMFAELVLFVIL